MAIYQNTTENLPKLKYGDTLTDNFGKTIGIVKFDYKTGKPLTPDSPLKNLSTYGMTDAGASNSYADLLRRQSMGEDIVNTGEIRSQIMSQYQDRINAINDIYNQQLQKARQEGVGRIGSGTAVLAARGLAGSMRGGAIKEDILDQNRQIEGAIDAERNAKIQEIYGLASQAATEEAARRREAMMSGAKSYIDYIKTQGETKKSNLSSIATQMLAQGIDPSTISQEELSSLAKTLGVSTNDIIGTYKQVQFENKATDKKGFELSEGQARYEFDPETGTYKQVAAMGKTYKPSSTGNVTPNKVSSVAEAWARQIQNGQATFAQVPQSVRNEVAQALAAPSMSAARESDLKSSIELVDSMLANPKLGKISGAFDQITGGLIGKAALAKNQYKQLTALLSLENRSKLKGSGSISNYEAEQLAQAASALGRNLSDADFREQLTKIRNVFQGAVERSTQTMQSQTKQTTKMVSPDGTQMVYKSELTPQELQEAKDAGWIEE